MHQNIDLIEVSDNLFGESIHCILLLTASKCVKFDSDVGIGGKAMIINGMALDRLADAKLIVNEYNDMHVRIAHFRQKGQLSGSAGSAEG